MKHSTNFGRISTICIFSVGHDLLQQCLNGSYLFISHWIFCTRQKQDIQFKKHSLIIKSVILSTYYSIFRTKLLQIQKHFCYCLVLVSFFLSLTSIKIFLECQLKLYRQTTHLMLSSRSFLKFYAFFPLSRQMAVDYHVKCSYFSFFSIYLENRAYLFFLSFFCLEKKNPSSSSI